MAELNYWQAIGLDPLWVRRHQLLVSGNLSEPVGSVASETVELTHVDALNIALNQNVQATSLEGVSMPVTISSVGLDGCLLEAPADTLMIEETFSIHPVNPLSETLPINITSLDWPELISHIHECRACDLGCSRTHAVPGVGVSNAPWMIIGEAPGAEEDRLGEPFVGQAGKLLDLMLASLGLSRKENVYIANILKCRPPNNRRPESTEVQACISFLYRQLALVQPKVLLVLGATAAHALLDTDAPIGKLRGRVHQYQGLPMIVTYHPAYL